MFCFGAPFTNVFWHLLKQSIMFRYPPSRLQTLHSNLLFMPPSFYHPDPTLPLRPPKLQFPVFQQQPPCHMLHPLSTTLLQPFRYNISFCPLSTVPNQPLKYSTVHPPPPQFSQPPEEKTPFSHSTLPTVPSNLTLQAPHAPLAVVVRCLGQR